MAQNIETVDALLVGAGIMSATLAVLLKELDPGLKLEIVELQESGAIESSNPWNNAGTGHAGLCELNYTPQAADGSVDIKKAVHINSQFEVSKQFWSYLIAKGSFGSPKNFINPIPHLSFVRGDKDIAFLKNRFEALRQHHAFASMEYSEDFATMREWMPLMMQGRDGAERIAATRVEGGTDVNFGALTAQLLAYLAKQGGASVTCNQKVTGLERNADGWRVTIKDTQSGQGREVQARFVFLGAGGGALPLLQLSGIPEGKGFGGFPVSGQWLRCDNPEVVEKHRAKVYSQAEVGAPPMSVPHLDTRVVDGKTSLLFGPYAGFSTKFLKHGSFLDLPLSVRPSNLGPMLAVARDNMDLTRYLIKEVMQSQEQRLDALRKFYPDLNPADWRLEIAGQRVQIIKKDADKGGILQFGTELVAAGDGSIAALLGASPGASVTVSIMLELIERCFAGRNGAWGTKLAEIFPAREKVLQSDAARYREVSERCDELLELTSKSPVAA
ncbi:Malate:quinone oxidoreductase [compost metagenome]